MKLALASFLLVSGFLNISALPSLAPDVTPIAQANRSYIGTRYLSNTLPQGVEYRSGWLVGELRERDDFWLSQVRQRNQDWIWFQIRLGDQGQQAVFEVMDELALPYVRQGEGLQSACEQNGNPDPEIFAIARHTDTEYLTQIRQAWRANRTSQQIEPISTDGIRCYNPGWGV